MLHERSAYGLEKWDGTSSNLSASVLNHTSGSWKLGSWPNGGGIADNYITRYFAGWSALGRPASAGVHNITGIKPVNTAMFLRAVEHISRLDVVLVLEEAPTDEVARLLTALGLQPYQNSTRRGTRFSLAANNDLTDAALRALWKQHYWDGLIYALAQRRHHKLVEAWADVEARS